MSSPIIAPAMPPICGPIKPIYPEANLPIAEPTSAPHFPALPICGGRPRSSRMNGGTETDWVTSFGYKIGCS